MTTIVGVEAAKAEAALAREQMLATAHELQARLRPASLGRDAVEAVRRKGETIADDAVDFVRERPVMVSAAAAGAGALIGVGLLLRRRGKEEE